LRFVSASADSLAFGGHKQTRFLVVNFATYMASSAAFTNASGVDGAFPSDAGDYESHSKRYQDLAKLAITLSAAAIAFLISIIASDQPVAPAFAQRAQAAAPIVFGFFGSCIAFLVIFMVLQAVWYEQYCHSPDHSTYKRWKYALSTSIGWTGLLSFVLGFLWLARNLFQS